jgi:hypothetical protein
VSIWKDAMVTYLSQAKTVGDLVKDLQRAIIVGELDEDSEILNHDLEPAVITINPMHKHIVVE